MVQEPRPLRVLYIEDSENDALLMTDALGRAGHKVHSLCVTTAGEMDAALHNGSWDVIISDHTLPDFSAPQALALLQATGLDLPFIIVSGTMDEVIAVDALRAGAHDFITKGNLARLAPAIEREMRDADSRQQRRHAEGELGETLARFQEVWETTSDALSLSDAEGLVLAANPAYHSLYGYTPEQVVGKSFAIIFPPALHDGMVAQYKQVFARNAPLGVFETTVCRADGTERIVESRATFITTQGRRTAMLSNIRDITERKRSEVTLAASERRFQALIENSADAITLVNEAGTAIYDTPSAARMLGYRPDELVGRSAFERMHPDDVALAEAILRQSIAEPTAPNSGQLRLQHRGGSWRWVEFIVTNLMAEPGVQAVVVNYRDITERKRADEAVHEANQRALQDYGRLLERLAILAQAVGTAPDLTGVYDALRRYLEATTPAQGLFVSLFNAERQERTCVYASSHGAIEDVSQLPALPMTGSPASRAILNREIIITDDFQAAIAGQPGVDIGMDIDPTLPQSSLAAPMMILGRVIGGFEIQSTQPRAFTPQHEKAVRLAANLAAIATDNLHLLDAERQLRQAAEGAAQRIARQLEQLAGLRAIDAAISSSLDLNLTLTVLLEQVIAQLGVHAADVLLLSQHTLDLTFAAGSGVRKPAHLPQRLGQGHAGRVALERRLVTVTNLREASLAGEPAGPQTADEFVSYFGVPLMAKGEVKGVLEVFHRAPLVPDADWLAYLHILAGQAAIAIDSAQLFDNLQSKNAELTLSYDATIEGWSNALDLRDRETEGHSQRVTEMTLRLAEAAGMAEAELVHVRRGALLHDIGKMGVPDSILLKPGTLSDEEWIVMRKHPTLAYQLLSPINFLRPALDIPYCHHEKWDGTGYPRGLKGEEIPLAARIFAVVDVWDALNSDRPYRPAWPPEKVLAHVREQSGRHFDPQVVAAFEAWYAAGAATPHPAAPTRPTLLIVDDEENITSSLERGLRADFTILVAHSGAAALAILAHEPVAVILTDQRMAGLTGLEVLRQAQAISPATRGLLISGYSDSTALAATLHLENVRGFIPKPWNVADLDRQLHAAAAEYLTVQCDQQIVATLRRHEP